MGKVLVIQGAGMNMRGKVQVETFGPMTLDEMNEQIRGFAEGLGDGRGIVPFQHRRRSGERPVRRA